MIAARDKETTFLDHIKTLETNEEEMQNEIDAANKQISRLNVSLESCLEKVENFSKNFTKQQNSLQRCETETTQLKSLIEHLQM